MKIKYNISLLYVEDDKEVSSIMKEMLDRFFGTVFIANNGYEGLDLFTKNKPDLVISDIMMPKMDGIEMSKKIKELDKDAKIILITADNEELFYQKAKTLDILDYMKKPIDFKQLLKTIENSLNN